MVLRQTTPAGPCSQSLSAHQPFDLVQSQRKPAASISCQTRLAPSVRSLAGKLDLTWGAIFSSVTARALGGRFSQA